MLWVLGMQSLRDKIDELTRLSIYLRRSGCFEGWAGFRVGAERRSSGMGDYDSVLRPMKRRCRFTPGRVFRVFRVMLLAAAAILIYADER
jgi:hypothetical protein